MSHQVLSNNYRATDTHHGKENQATAREIKIVKNRVHVIRCPSKTRFWHRKGPPNPKPNQNSAAGDMRTRVRQVMGITLNAKRLNHVHRGLPQSQHCHTTANLLQRQPSPLANRLWNIITVATLWQRPTSNHTKAYLKTEGALVPVACKKPGRAFPN
jgi:hypothetical protein